MKSISEQITNVDRELKKIEAKEDLERFSKGRMTELKQKKKLLRRKKFGGFFKGVEAAKKIASNAGRAYWEFYGKRPAGTPKSRAKKDLKIPKPKKQNTNAEDFWFK